MLEPILIGVVIGLSVLILLIILIEFIKYCKKNKSKKNIDSATFDKADDIIDVNNNSIL